MPLGKYWRSNPLKFSFNPRSAVIRFGEIAVTAQRLIDGLVAVELPAVSYDGVYHGFEVRQQIVMAWLVRAAVSTYWAGEIQLTTPLCQRDNGALVGFSHHQVGFPIAQPGACRHDSRALVNIYPARIRPR